jgi:GNAT superfamily N-acetyltransferase
MRGLEAIISNKAVGHILTARIDNRVVGMVNLLYTISTALGERVALLEDLVISPQEQGQGIGSQLLAQTIAFADSQGCKRITLLTDGDNHIAQKFYRNHGFIQSSMIPMRLQRPMSTAK